MNPHLIERLAHERMQERLRRAEIDGRMHASGHRIVRRPFQHLPPLGLLFRGRLRQESCSAPASCHA